jgi:D-sedoheptulose 7-phosphate isomerase
LIQNFKESTELISKLQSDSEIHLLIEKIISICVDVFKSKKAIYFCGNGGSAAEAQHLSAEFSGRYKLNRKALKSEALHVNSSFITAVANDYGYNAVYARALEALGEEGDVLFILSTSGMSPNVIEAANKAKEMGITTIGMTGSEGGHLSALCDIVIKVPSTNTPRIQEAHLLIGHIICEEVETKLFS